MIDNSLRRHAATLAAVALCLGSACTQNGRSGATDQGNTAPGVEAAPGGSAHGQTSVSGSGGSAGVMSAGGASHSMMAGGAGGMAGHGGVGGLAGHGGASTLGGGPGPGSSAAGRSNAVDPGGGAR